MQPTSVSQAHYTGNAAQSQQKHRQANHAGNAEWKICMHNCCLQSYPARLKSRRHVGEARHAAYLISFLGDASDHIIVVTLQQLNLCFQLLQASSVLTLQPEISVHSRCDRHALGCTMLDAAAASAACALATPHHASNAVAC